MSPRDLSEKIACENFAKLSVMEERKRMNMKREGYDVKRPVFDGGLSFPELDMCKRDRLVPEKYDIFPRLAGLR